MRRPPQILFGAALSLLGVGSALADGIILDGVSAYTIGRGGTNIGFADNGSILHDNPAAMGQIESEGMFQLGATGLWTEFQYSDPDNVDVVGQHQFYVLPEISYIRKMSDEWAFGAGIFSPAGFGSIFNLNGPAPFAGPQRYESFGSLSKLLFGASYTPDDRLSFGATIGPALSFANFEGPYTLQGPGFPGLPTLIDMEVDGFALVWSAGVQYQLTDSTTIGAAYQSRSKIDATGTTNVDTPLGPSSYDTEATITWPQSVGVGARQQLTSRQVVSVDVIWFDWSAAFDTFDITLTNPSNPMFPELVEEFPLNWRDTVSTRLGYEYHFTGGQVIRAGYVYHRNPSPANTMTVFIPAALEQATSLGYGWMWRDWNINLAYMYSFGSHVYETDSALIGGDYDNSEHYDQTHAAAISFTKLLGPKQGCDCASAVR